MFILIDFSVILFDSACIYVCGKNKNILFYVVHLYIDICERICLYVCHVYLYNIYIYIYHMW